MGKGHKIRLDDTPVEESMKRPIALPTSLWAKLEKDAARCRRTLTKQIEAIMVMYYGLDDVDMDKSKFKQPSE